MTLPLLLLLPACLAQAVLHQFGVQFTWDLKAKQMGKKALESAQVGCSSSQQRKHMTVAGVGMTAAAAGSSKQ